MKQRTGPLLPIIIRCLCSREVVIISEGSYIILHNSLESVNNHCKWSINCLAEQQARSSQVTLKSPSCMSKPMVLPLTWQHIHLQTFEKVFEQSHLSETEISVDTSSCSFGTARSVTETDCFACAGNYDPDPVTALA